MENLDLSLSLIRKTVVLLALVNLQPAVAGEWQQILVKDQQTAISESAGILYYRDKPFDGELVHLHMNGQISRRTAYAQGLKDGLELSWLENGDLAEVRDYERGNKAWVHWSWYANGRRSFAAEFQVGVYHGRVQSWYPGGQPASDQHFDKGYESGLQRAWRENGALYANYEFRDGRRYGLYNPGLCFQLDKNGKTN